MHSDLSANISTGACHLYEVNERRSACNCILRTRMRLRLALLHMRCQKRKRKYEQQRCNCLPTFAVFKTSIYVYVCAVAAILFAFRFLLIFLRYLYNCFCIGTIANNFCCVLPATAARFYYVITVNSHLDKSLEDKHTATSQ